MSETDAIIVIADDHPLVRDALRQAIARDFAGPEFRDAASLAEAESAIRSGQSPDLVLLDLHMPGMRGFTGLAYLRSQFPAVPVAMISASTDARIMRQAIDYGASGFIPKSAPMDEIRGAVTEILAGNTWLPASVDSLPETNAEDAALAARLAALTPQQLRVLGMLSDGKLNKQIAYDLDISEATVKSHVSAILQKLDVNSRTQAVILAGRLNVEDPAREIPA
ncbi:MAG: response regulator transcription factor [Alphaproteobacteria bacterium]|nr:response regulator transcription factor [Alphaproteobacteria bacterium]